ncbi:MAG TPA: hypothetical protein DCZ94_07030 [Lentisphaeria bacterium]|nr:MAG: hypothetical protein A2X48_10355 [Lentisphaerae bacterium GWF2_49_21]HBC86688.1 hypothetical protein [Lentisphaeria bacterium]
MNFVKKIYLFLIFCIFSCHLQAQEKALQADGARKLKAALISGMPNNTDSIAYEDMLFMKMGSVTGLELIERENIRKILKEHNISAENSGNPESILQLGRLIRADMFIIIEKQPDNKYQLTFIELKTAVLLQKCLILEKDFEEKNFSGLDKALAKTLKRFSQPDASRAYLCISGIFNEEPGDFLKPYAAEIEDIIQNGLNDIDNMILLDRKHAEFLSKESVLTGDELKLKASAIMLRGGIRRTNEGKLNLTVDFSKVLASGGIKKSLELELAKIKESKEKINKLILDGFNEEVKSSGGQDKKLEAEKLFAESKVFATDKNFLKSAELCESALLLDSKDEYLNAAILAWGRVFDDRPLPFTTKLKAAIRKKELEIARLDSAIKNGDRLPGIENISFYGTGKGGDEYFMSIQDDPAKGRRDYELACELKRLRLEEVAMRRNYFGDMLRTGKSNSKYYKADNVSACGSIISTIDCLKGFIDNEGIVKDMVTEFEMIAASREISPGTRDSFANCLASFMFYENETNNKFAWKQRTEKLIELAKWLTERKDPLIRAKAWLMLGHMKALPDGECKIKSISIVMDEVSAKTTGYSTYDMLDSYFSPSMNMSVADLNTLLAARIEKCITEKDAYHLTVFKVLLTSWLDRMWYTLKKDELEAPIDLSARLLSVLYLEREKIKDKKDTDLYNYSIRLEPTIKAVEHYNNQMKLKAETIKKEAASPTPWDSFLTEKVADISKPANAYRIEGMTVANNCIYCIWSGKKDDKIDYVIATKTDLKTLETTEVGRLKASGLYNSITSIVITDPGSVFVSTLAGSKGLIIISPNGSRLLTEEDGLPSKNIISMAEMGGKLYMGFKSGYRTGAFYSYDIKNNKFDLIASTKNATPKNELDGKPFLITKIITVKDENTIWFSVDSEFKTGIGGLWKINKDGNLEKFHACSMGISDFYFIPDGIMIYEDFSGYQETIKLSTPSLSKVVLTSPNKGSNPKFSLSIYKWPVFPIGDLLLSNNGSTSGIYNSCNKHFEGPSGSFLTMGNPELFYFVKDTQLWKLSPKPKMDK